jgi:hypothetical protein
VRKNLHATCVRDCRVIERFTQRAPQDFVVNQHAKSFVRVASCAGRGANPHTVSLLSGRYMDALDVSCDPTGRSIGITSKVNLESLRPFDRGNAR